MERLLGVVENAAEAERRVTEELRQMGHDVLQAWARRQAERKENEVAQGPGVQRKKKNVDWSTRYGPLEVVEQIFRQGAKAPEIRPFTPSAEGVCRGGSEPL